MDDIKVYIRNCPRSLRYKQQIKLLRIQLKVLKNQGWIETGDALEEIIDAIVFNELKLEEFEEQLKEELQPFNVYIWIQFYQYFTFSKLKQ